MSRILLFAIFYAGIEENIFSQKFEIYSFKTLENDLADFVDTFIILFIIFKALSNKSNLYFACSSPLRDIDGGHIHKVCQK